MSKVGVFYSRSMKQRMGPQTSGQAHPTATTVVGAAGIAQRTARQFVPPSVPTALEAVALVDAKVFAAVGDMSVSWLLEEVAAGRAPQPVIRRPRCTRWRLVDVRAFWQAFGSQPNDGAADAVKALATKASAAAQAKRRTLAAIPQAGA